MLKRWKWFGFKLEYVKTRLISLLFMLLPTMQDIWHRNSPWKFIVPRWIIEALLWSRNAARSQTTLPFEVSPKEFFCYQSRITERERNQINFLRFLFDYGSIDCPNFGWTQNILEFKSEFIKISWTQLNWYPIEGQFEIRIFKGLSPVRNFNLCAWFGDLKCLMEGKWHLCDIWKWQVRAGNLWLFWKFA